MPRVAAGFADLSGPVTDRRCSTCRQLPISIRRCGPLQTAAHHTVSNTAFRGFGGPQGMVGAERFIEDIAYATGLDPLEVRKRNLYGGEGRDVTPYHQEVEDMIAGG
jgi:xanthine dehydrogenase large subunit